MIALDEFRVKTHEREVLIDITNEVNNIIRKYDVKEGVCRVYIPHTTAGITINENADPSVIKDISNYMNRLIPKGGGLGYSFRHGEGNSDAHIKSSIIGVSEAIIIEKSKLVLGTWQKIFFTEFDGPRNRKVIVKIIS